MLGMVSLGVGTSVSKASPIFAENFEDPQNQPYQLFVENIERFGLMEILPEIGVKGTRGLRVKYEGSRLGSERNIIDFVLPEKGLEMTLNFDVMFEDGFEFVLGGKLNGLGPLKKVTGGREMKPDGWSARIMWREKGVVENYLYHQDKLGEYGERGRKVPHLYTFDRGKYHAISIHVRVNEDPEKATGFSRIYVDGKLVDGTEGVRFRAVATPESEICQFLFSTFHGGAHTEICAQRQRGELHRCFCPI